MVCMTDNKLIICINYAPSGNISCKIKSTKIQKSKQNRYIKSKRAPGPFGHISCLNKMTQDQTSKRLPFRAKI